jgi:hypothetical protein
MRIFKIPLQNPQDECSFYLEMNKNEFGEMCKFMIDNGIGYGQGRRLTEKWRKAREGYEKEKKS